MTKICISVCVRLPASFQMSLMIYKSIQLPNVSYDLQEHPASKCLLWFTRASSFQMSLMLMRKYMSIHPASKCRFCVVIWALWALHPRVLLLWRLFQPQTYDFNHQWAWPESHEPYWSRKHGSNWSRFLAY